MGCGASADGGGSATGAGAAPEAANANAPAGPNPLTVAVPEALTVVWAAWVKVDGASTNGTANDRATPNPLAKVCEHTDPDGPKFLHALLLNGAMTDVAKLRDARVLTKGQHYHFEVNGQHPSAPGRVTEKLRFCVEHDGVGCTVSRTRQGQGHEF